MIKAKGEDQHGNPVLLFGLSGENLRRLRQGQPIKIDLSEFGLPGLAGHAFILYGNTEEAMIDSLRRLGVLSEELATHPTSDEQA